jgi:hypothetical protein
MVLSGSPKLSPNTTLTDSSTSLHTMLLKTRHLNSSVQRYVLVVLGCETGANNIQGWGERLVREIYPETTIVRPAPMFGFEDRLLHKLAGVTNFITSNHMQEKYWPVHVS